jgi:hypothetical protein
MKALFSTIMTLGLLASAQAKTGSESLYEAHRSFLKGNLSAMVRHITTVLQQGDTVENRNALKLLEKAYAVNNGNLPSDFKLPSEILRLRIFVRRRLNEDTRFRLGIRGATKEKGTVTQIQVIRYPDKVVLDKNGGVGEWNENYDAEDKSYYISLTGAKEQNPIPSGLYFIHMKLSNGKTIDGYVILSNLNASTSPEIVSPYNGETVTTSQPTLKWKNYLSPQHQGSEKRYVSVDVYENSEVNDYKDVWNFWEEDPHSEQATVGQKEGGAGDKLLADGPFSISLNFQERRKFGDIYVSRESQANRNFYVKTK